jgi:hypothetical protein
MLLARVYASHFLLGRWPKEELGWWYIFFQPTMIRETTAGYLHFSSRPRLALRVVYVPDEEKQQKVYLAPDNPSHLQRVWDDLRRDAPKPRAH